MTNRHQLIDLNKEYVNFKLQFEVRAKDEKEFDALVIEQAQLDSNGDLNNLNMKRAKGSIGASITADKNKSQNFFLVMKSVTEEPTEVEVAIDLEEIPASTLDESSTGGQGPPSTITTPGPSSPPPQPVSTRASPFYTQPWFILVVIGVVLGSALFYYLFYVRKNLSSSVALPAPAPPSSELHLNPPPAQVLPSDASLYSKLRSIS